MKTRPNNNSVSKWTKEGKIKVKSIVEWIIGSVERQIAIIFNTNNKRNQSRKQKEGKEQYIPQWDKHLWMIVCP